MRVINLKLPDEAHARFHEMVRKCGGTMQSVLCAFVIAYIENSEQFKVKMEVSSDHSSVNSGSSSNISTKNNV